METQLLDHKNDTAIPVIEGNLPQVSFDIELGKKYENVDFDYDAFKSLIRRMGGTDSDYEDAKILVETRGRNRNGSYNPHDNMIRVGARKGSIVRSDNSDSTLTHETQHYLDDRHGNLNSPVITKIAGNLAAPVMDAGIGLTVLGYMSSILNRPEVSNGVRLAATILSIGGIAMHGIYLNSQDEIRARSSARKHTRSVLTLEPR